MGIVGEQIEVGQANVRLVDDLEGDGQSDMGLAGGQVGDGQIDMGFIKVRDEQVDMGLV